MWKNHLNVLLTNLTSKRVWVMVITSIALFTKLIGATEWLAITTIFLGDRVATNLMNQKGTTGNVKKES